MWQRFSERARKVVFYAQEESQQFGEGYVSTEHLLLGLVRESDSVAARVLEKLGISLNRIRSEVEKQIARGDRKAIQDMTLTPRAKRVIDLAYEEANNLNNNYIGTEHLLLGLIREGDGLGGKVLARLGVELEATRQVVIELQSGGAGSERVAGKGTFRPRRVCRLEDSALLVVDLQDSFLAPIPDKERILHRASFLIEIANLLQVPIFATEQYAARMGDTNERIMELLKGGPRYDKLCFSSCRDATFWEAWDALGMRQAVIVGIETHICVNQTVHDLLSRGGEVFVCADAVSARLPDAHEIALQRMRQAGAIITHTESVAYEWLGEAGTPEFRSSLEIIKRYAP